VTLNFGDSISVISYETETVTGASNCLLYGGW